MGSGRGKNKRILSTSPAISDAAFTFDLNVWKTFVNENKLSKVKAAPYYELQLPPDPLHRARLVQTVGEEAAEDQARCVLATEIFCDLLDTGALTLPAGVARDACKFRIRMGILILARPPREIGKEEDVRVVSPYANYYLSDQIRLGSKASFTLCQDIANALSDLVLSPIE